jgi:hypothetical protein
VIAGSGEALAVGAAAEAFEAGDLVTWRLPSGAPHIGIVSDRHAPDGTPLIVHNIGAGTREEDVLRAFTITGHYRFTPAPAAPR